SGTGNNISSGAAALVANGVTFGATFDTVSSGGGTNNVSLANVAGTLTMNGGALSGSTAGNPAFRVADTVASNGAITYAGTIAKTTGGAGGNVVSVSGKTAGSVTLSGGITNNACGGD